MDVRARWAAHNYGTGWEEDNYVQTQEQRPWYTTRITLNSTVTYAIPCSTTAISQYLIAEVTVLAEIAVVEEVATAHCGDTRQSPMIQGT